MAISKLSENSKSEQAMALMKCLVKEDLDKDGLTLMTAHPEPQMKLDEVKIKVLATAVCGTDKSIFTSAQSEGIRNEMKRYIGSASYSPIVVGHEFCGIVEAVGDGAQASSLAAPDHLRVEVGDYVTAEDGTQVWDPDSPRKLLIWQEDGLWMHIGLYGDAALVADEDDLIELAESLQ